LEVPHFSTAAPLSATRRTFQPPFTTAGRGAFCGSGMGLAGQLSCWMFWRQGMDVKYATNTVSMGYFKPEKNAFSTT